MANSATATVGGEGHAGAAAGSSRVASLLQRVESLEQENGALTVKVAALEKSAAEFRALVDKLEPTLRKFGKSFGIVIS
jgi:hypothetical protein